MASEMTNPAKKNLVQAWVDAATDIKMMLLDSNHATNIDTQEHIEDVDDNEVAGTGYTAGGQSLTGVAVVADSTEDRSELSYDPATWDASGGALSASYAVFYDDTGDPATSQILFILDFGGEQTAENDTFTVDADEEGALQIA